MSMNLEMPGSPKIYEFEDAVRFTAQWTELDVNLVSRILEAKHRYLELAGIAECHQDDAYIREREAYQHLLPETPTFIDHRETTYVALATGADEQTIDRVSQGETAYLDTLDLVEWSDDQERDLSLGSPCLEGVEGQCHQQDSNGVNEVLHELEALELTFLAAPSFRAEYGVKVMLKGGVCRLWTMSTPDTELPCHITDFPRTPGRRLPVGEADLLQGILRDIRISPIAKGDLGCDGITYRLQLSQGLTTLDLGWWCTLPQGWEELKHLVGLLEHYASKYGRKPRRKGDLA